MIDIRTICTHDARKLAETLVRLLEAEEHVVRLTYGRQSLHELEDAKESRDAVLLIWSPDAPSQTYMLEWARQIDPERLVEVALSDGWPRIDRKSPVIDFSKWRGERGAKPWNALNERLRVVARGLEPPKPPPARAALALGAASLAAVGVAFVVRVNDAPVTTAADEAVHEQVVAALPAPHVAVGGAVVALEPASVEDLAALQRLSVPRFEALELTPAPDLVQLADYEPAELRPPTLMERIVALNPLDDQSEEQAPTATE